MTKSIFIMSLLLSSCSLFAQSSIPNSSDAISGEWVNVAKDAKFEIFKSANKYFGKITWGTGVDSKDSKNPDPKLRNRDLVGLVILQDFVFEGKNTWSDGTIYDPKDGKTYSCKLTLTSINKLNVRGYVGISLFGRTETWTRI